MQSSAEKKRCRKSKSRDAEDELDELAPDTKKVATAIEDEKQQDAAQVVDVSSARHALKLCKLARNKILDLALQDLQGTDKLKILIETAAYRMMSTKAVAYFEGKVLVFVCYGNWSDNVLLSKADFDAIRWYDGEYDYSISLPDSYFGRLSYVEATFGDIYAGHIDDPSRIFHHYITNNKDIWERGVIKEFIDDYDVVELHNRSKSIDSPQT